MEPDKTSLSKNRKNNVFAARPHVDVLHARTLPDTRPECIVKYLYYLCRKNHKCLDDFLCHRYINSDVLCV